MIPKFSNVSTLQESMALLLVSDEPLDLNFTFELTPPLTFVVVHAENSDMIDWMTSDLARRGMVSPWNHGTSRPNIVESEATNRVLALAELLDTPVLFVHVSAPEAFRVIREAQGKMMSVFAETCPHYLLLTGEAMRAPDFEGKSPASLM